MELVQVKGMIEHGSRSLGLSTLEAAGFLEKACIDLDQAYCPLVHRFGPGVYIREVTIPGGTLWVGHEHTMDHLCVVLKGETDLLTEDGSFITIPEGTTFVGHPGRKTGLAKSELVLCNIFSTRETNMKVLESQIFVKTEVFDEHVEAINRKRREDGKASAEDFEKAGFAHKAFEHECPLPYGGYKFQVSESGIHGDGLLACGDIKKDDYIGHVWMNGGLTQIAQYVNHGVDPNAFVDEHGAMWALRDIKGNFGGELGEEITVDYRSCKCLV